MCERYATDIFLSGPEPHQHRQECLCHTDPAVLARMLIILARASVAQTLLSVLWQAAAPDLANPGSKTKTPPFRSGVITTSIVGLLGGGDADEASALAFVV